MPAVALSSKLQIVTPKSIHQSLNSVADEQLERRTGDGRVEQISQVPVTALRGLCPEIDSYVPNDPESVNWPGGCGPVPTPASTPSAET